MYYKHLNLSYVRLFDDSLAYNSGRIRQPGSIVFQKKKKVLNYIPNIAT